MGNVTARPRVGYPRGSDTGLPVDVRAPFVTLKLAWRLEPSAEYRLSASFRGKFRHGDHHKWPPGVYREALDSYATVTTYVDQPHVAAFFPSLQSAKLRSIFSLSVVKPKASFAALSSWDLLKDVQGPDGGTYSIFEKTPPIALHHVAVAVTDLPKETDGFTTLRAHPKNMGRLRHLLEFSTNIVELAAEATGTSFPNRGLDLVAVHRFPRACHASWKLVVVRTGTFKATGSGGSHTNLGRPYLRLSIELLSTWFGGMVSVNPWLDKGLALLYAIKVLKLAKPQWLLDDILHLYRFVARTSVNLGPTHEKVLYDYELPISAVSLLSMFRFAAGHDSFKAATTVLLKNAMQQDPVEDDFWEHLRTSSSMEPLADYAKVWRHQTGYPLLTVTRENSETVQVTQEPFRDPGGQDMRNRSTRATQVPLQPPSPQAVWPVPITLKYASEPTRMDVTAVVWMTTSEVTLKAPNAHFDDWVLLNVGNEGLYRVEYDDSNWRHLIRQLCNDSSVIPVANRAQILDDLFHLALSGYRQALSGARLG
ncbi:hypothetical protein HPB48_002493 [Haemaphysalis longicornis]|uniref:ERAP1-like C-terminal domain-containing protein n=1 Tax=Haemaphysalis longicornis TaxID=44386 RepID=A0A9J6G7S0_HAELO|nr:hypothetical protein HPB48_002493 [Haemaphysalis longicornis]